MLVRQVCCRMFLLLSFSYRAGMFYAATVLGPVIAFIGGGFLLKLYTHFDTVDTSTLVNALQYIMLVS